MRKVLIAAVAAVGLVMGAVPAAAVEHKEYIGVYWNTISFTYGNAQGGNGGVMRSIWMDRATSSNPARWDGRLGLRREAYLTGIESHGNTYWWRTCFETPGSNSRVLCGSWFHP
ncbi:hypothetical protein PV646_07445 [Streptomyces sp. ID05-26A]|nr:hypothetical protein [Streptomyces sp. ID05-26A]